MKKVIVLLLVLGLFLAQVPQMAHAGTGAFAKTLPGENTNVRSLPSTDADIVTTLGPNTLVGVYGRNADASWLKVNMIPDASIQGWIRADRLVFISIYPEGSDIGSLKEIPVELPATQAATQPATTQNEVAQTNTVPDTGGCLTISHEARYDVVLDGLPVSVKLLNDIADVIDSVMLDVSGRGWGAGGIVWFTSNENRHSVHLKSSGEAGGSTGRVLVGCRIYDLSTAAPATETKTAIIISTSYGDQVVQLWAMLAVFAHELTHARGVMTETNADMRQSPQAWDTAVAQAARNQDCWSVEFDEYDKIEAKAAGFELTEVHRQQIAAMCQAIKDGTDL